MAKKPFASSADLDEKTETLEVLADGVYALTAEGDPNVGAIEAEDYLIAFEARATPQPTAAASTTSADASNPPRINRTPAEMPGRFSSRSPAVTSRPISTTGWGTRR